MSALHPKNELFKAIVDDEKSTTSHQQVFNKAMESLLGHAEPNLDNNVFLDCYREISGSFNSDSKEETKLRSGYHSKLRSRMERACKAHGEKGTPSKLTVKVPAGDTAPRCLWIPWPAKKQETAFDKAVKAFRKEHTEANFDALVAEAAKLAEIKFDVVRPEQVPVMAQAQAH